MINITHTFLFVDLCGYSEYSWIHGDDCAAEVAVNLTDQVRRLATAESCEFVKSLGDGAMVRAGDPRDAIRLAERIRRAIHAEGPLDVRIGLDTGTAVRHGDDWYGTTVNTAARVCKLAQPGQMWMTERVREAIRHAHTVDPVDCGLRALKGLPDCSLHAA